MLMLLFVEQVRGRPGGRGNHVGDPCCRPSLHTKIWIIGFILSTLSWSLWKKENNLHYTQSLCFFGHRQNFFEMTEKK